MGDSSQRPAHAPKFGAGRRRRFHEAVIPVVQQTRVVAMGARVLYVGRAFELAAHKSGVAVLCTALDGEVLATDAVSAPQAEWMRCRSVFVPAGTRHIMHFTGGPIACLYADPAAGADVAALAGEMRVAAGKLRFHHRREGELSALFRKFAARALHRDELQPALRDMLGLAEHAAPSDARVARALQHIREQPALPHSLRSLAREVGISESRLRHAFKDATGVPVARFRLWVRLAAALRTIQQGSDLTSAALDAGFSSSAHFSNAYRGMFGMTPSALMQAERESRARASHA
jgi:AraC-like DNA-binding protein